MLFVQYIFHSGESYSEMCASVDLLNKYFLHKLINPVHSGIFYCNSLQITFLCVWLAEKSYHIYFCQQKSCLHNVIAIFQYILFHLGWTQKLIFCCVHQYFLCIVKISFPVILQMWEKNPALERILIHFEPDDLLFIHCCQQLCS